VSDDSAANSHGEVTLVTELCDAIESDDPFTVAIRGHQVIDELLNLLLVEALAEPDVVELRRLTFGLKADLVSALYGLPERGTLAQVNRIRNRLAHNRAATLDATESEVLKSAWSAGLSEGFERARLDLTFDTAAAVGVLRYTFIALGVVLERALSEARDRKESERLFYQVIIDAADHKLEGRPTEVIERRLEESRAARRARGQV
jgi:hypothetical protein